MAKERLFAEVRSHTTDTIGIMTTGGKLVPLKPFNIMQVEVDEYDQLINLSRVNVLRYKKLKAPTNGYFDDTPKQEVPKQEVKTAVQKGDKK